jgi:hypothetical protein
VGGEDGTVGLGGLIQNGGHGFCRATTVLHRTKFTTPR